jgi:hypothetical protein
MDLDYPRFVFTAPGPTVCQGGSYGTELVKNDDELAAAIDAGFFMTIPEALKGIPEAHKGAPDVTPADIPPSKFKTA